MSDTLEGLRHQINGAKDLESVVRTMKVMAASNIIQYEKAVELEDRTEIPIEDIVQILYNRF